MPRSASISLHFDGSVIDRRVRYSTGIAAFGARSCARRRSVPDVRKPDRETGDRGDPHEPAIDTLTPGGESGLSRIRTSADLSTNHVLTATPCP
jgi:hypothetical protein